MINKGYGLGLCLDERDLTVVPQTHGDDHVPPVDHAVGPQYAVRREYSLLDQSPWSFEQAEVLLSVAFPEGVFHAGNAIGVDLRRIGTEVDFHVKGGGEVLAVLLLLLLLYYYRRKDI